MEGVFKSFVSEKEIEEVKQKRQEEWEKVRRPDQPLGKFESTNIVRLDVHACSTCMHAP